MANQRRDPEHRPSPEALLEAARREDSPLGKLKIFVGAAPGLGKTYEMLQSAHARLKAGTDVVVGFVETHGRAETEALLRVLEVVPRKRIEYKDQILEEMDIDAVIAYQKLPNFDVVVNKKSAASMGVTLPQAVLARAARIVE